MLAATTPMINKDATPALAYEGLVVLLLSHLRIQRQLTQKTMANLLDVSPKMLARIENGTASLSIEEFFIWAHKLNMTPVQVLMVVEQITTTSLANRLLKQKEVRDFESQLHTTL